MRTYDTYKDSGISWLGQIPSHWELKTLRNFLIPFSLKGFPELQMLSVTREQGVILRDMERESNHNVIPEDLSGYKVVRRGQFVINKMKSWQGSYGVSKFEGIVSPAYFVYDLNIANKDFFHIALRSRAYIPFFMQFSKGIRVDQWDLSPIALKSIPFVLPTPCEQEAIVAYLDSATAEIDKAIASQQRMVELLQERKQIIINQAVTQGLNPDAPMKPTNIDWLPQIPSHWQLKKIKYVVLLKSGQNLTSEQIEKEDLYPVYGGNGLRGYYSDFNNDGDYVLIGRQGALCGNINYAHNKFWATEHAVVCYPVENVNVLWLGETLRAMNLNRYATASAQPGLAVENIKGLMMPVPDYKEQNDIADFIEKQTKPIDDSIERCNRMIGALTERKQILINDVVTGKIKI